MKYFGREDFREGGVYPVGFHWGYIRNWPPNAEHVEHYVVLRIPTPFRKEKLAYDIDLMKPHVLTFLAFIAWPYKDFPSKLRWRFVYFWVPIYGR